MIDLSNALNFEQYLEKNTVEERAELLKKLETTKLSPSGENSVKEIKDPVKLVVFSEGYCPDCTATIPFVKRIQEVNNNIGVYIFPRKGNENVMEELTGDSRIPTVLAFSDKMEPKGAYLEVPKELLDKMAPLNNEAQQELIKEYRVGKYNDLIESELISILK